MARYALRLGWVTLGLLVGALIALLWAYGRYQAPGPHKNPLNVMIISGNSVEGIARRLAGAGVIEQPLIFRFGVRLTGIHKSLKAGEYAIPPHASPREIADILLAGQTVAHRLTVIEGATSYYIVARLKNTEPLSGDIRVPAVEGSLLPETYHFSRGDRRAAILDRMRADMQSTLAGLWQSRHRDTPLMSPGEALILASIVEKETGVADERPRVAAVFLNRLRRGMRLQSDPTVLYALTRGEMTLDRLLTRADLGIDSPYNTYVVAGLPPGPICNPGAAAIAAVLQPADTDELYFVANGRGGHAFAKTLVEHNNNVRKWRRLQRDRKNAKP
ncbi:MAG: endolytic transglycosylase MltG [Rhodospirillales bacterium]|jgi:UPF0755 protein